MRLMVQDFLVNRGASDLRSMHGVKLRWSQKRPGVFTLNYDQLEVVDTDPLSQECRGLILRAIGGQVTDDRPVGATEIVALPFARFFNHGTGPCARVDFDSARFYEKLDGTLCIVHHDGGAWHVATRSVPDADVPIDGGDPQATFRTLYERSLPPGVALGDGLDPSCTYMFELTAPENQVVVRYDDRAVTLLGVREVTTGQERDPALVGPTYRVCPWHSITLETMLEWIAERDPAKHEGVVVCDSQYRRCKVKSPGYVALAHTRESVGKSPRAMMELILLGKDDDARPLLPEYLYPRIDAMKVGLAAELARIDAAYEHLRPHNDDRKAFALRINASAYPSDMAALMSRFAGKCQDAAGWVQLAKKEGTWPPAFLDVLVERAAR